MSRKDNYTPYNDTDEPEEIGNSFDTIGLLLDYLAHWKLFIISLVVCLCAAWCYKRTRVPTFQVGASVYLNDDSASKAKEVLSMDPMGIGQDLGASFDETEIEIMKSRNSLMKVVDSLNLAYSYYRVGNWRNFPIYKKQPINARISSSVLDTISEPIRIEIEKKNNSLTVNFEYDNLYSSNHTVDKLPAVISTEIGDIELQANDKYYEKMEGTNIIVIRSPKSVAVKMKSNLDIQYAENASTILNFTYNTPLPELGQDVLDLIIYFYNRQVVEDKNLSAIQTEEFIQARLIDVQNELKEASNRVREYEERKNIVDRQQQISKNLTQSSQIQNEISNLRANEVSLLDVLKVARTLEVSPSLLEISLLPAGTSNVSINTNIEHFNKDAQNYNRQRRDFTDQNDYIIRLANGLKSQRDQIIHSLEEAVKQVRNELSNKKAIESQSVSSLASQPAVAMGYKEVVLDEEVKNNILTFLLQRREEIALQKTLATPTAQFIDDPSVIAQVSPRTVFIYLLGFILGLIIPAIYLYFRYILFPKFKTKEDLERITTVPILGEICKADNGENDIVIGDNVSTSIAELFRLLRNNIKFARTGSEKKVILVTSSISGEGKTFIALNLAMTYALTGKRTLVMGLDIRRPVLAHKFGISNISGITSYLAEQVNNIDEIIYQTEVNPNLYIMPSGPIPPNPNELLMSERMESMFTQLREMFDFIIIDTAPIGMVSDSLLIIPFSDIQLYITRASYSNRKGIKVLHESIKAGHLPKSYIVLNGVNAATRSYNYRRYGYYSKSNQNYGYGYGRYSNHAKTGKHSFFKRIFGRK